MFYTHFEQLLRKYLKLKFIKKLMKYVTENVMILGLEMDDVTGCSELIRSHIS